MSEEDKPASLMQSLIGFLKRDEPSILKEKSPLIRDSYITDPFEAVRQVTFRFEEKENREDIRNLFEEIGEALLCFTIVKGVPQEDIANVRIMLKETPDKLRQAANYVDNNWEDISLRGFSNVKCNPKVYGRSGDDMIRVFSGDKSTVIDAFNKLADDMEKNSALYAKEIGLSDGVGKVK